MAIIILGDIMLGRYVLPVIQQVGIPNLLKSLKPYTDGHHVIANLESPLTNHQPEPGSTRLFAPPNLAKELSEFGFSGFSLANNHIFDCGIDGLTETIETLDNAGIQHTGAGLNIDQACKPMIIDSDGTRYGIISFSYKHPAGKQSPGVANLYDHTVTDLIYTTKKQVDFLIVMAHSGIELFQYPLPRDRKIYLQMIEHGADIVVGSHAHCIQAMEYHQNKPIFYSIGDFIFDHHRQEVWQNFWKETTHPSQFSIKADQNLPKHSLMISIKKQNHKLIINYEPLKMDNLPAPTFMTTKEKDLWQKHFSNINTALQTDQNTHKLRNTIEKKLMDSLNKRGNK